MKISVFFFAFVFFSVYAVINLFHFLYHNKDILSKTAQKKINKETYAYLCIHLYNTKERDMNCTTTVTGRKER